MKQAPLLSLVVPINFVYIKANDAKYWRKFATCAFLSDIGASLQLVPFSVV